jgi:NADH-ubiquinone oxidoreductase chain 4
MLLLLLLTPLIGIFAISATSYGHNLYSTSSNGADLINKEVQIKLIGIITAIVNLAISIVVFILFHFSSNVYQFVGEYHQINSFDIYLGVDGMSIYFVLLTTIIMPISLLSN